MEESAEEWKDIEGFEGYQVSNLGRVRSLDREETYSNGMKRFRKGSLLKPFLNSFGYLQVRLCKNGKMTTKKVHRLVAEAFLPNPNSLPQVNHKNELDKTDNRVESLEWCDAKYNNNYGTRSQRAGEALINRSDQSKKVYQYTLDGQLVKIWESTMECERNGYDNSNISACCLGRRNKHKGFIWKYE